MTICLSPVRCFRLYKMAPMSVSCSQQTHDKESFCIIPVRVKPVMRLKNLGITERESTFLRISRRNAALRRQKAFSFSSSGWDHTYAWKGFKDYHFDRFGTHANIQPKIWLMISRVLFEYRPDYILAIDFDTHTDHRGVSISFEERRWSVS